VKASGETMSDKSTSDANLARQCRQGDAAAWRQLIRRCSPAVFRIALRILRSQADAEDAAQEVFMRIHRSFETYDPTRPLMPWVCRITYNTCLQRLRGSGRRDLATAPEEMETITDPLALGPEEEAEATEVEALVLGAMTHLSAQDRALMVMRYREGLTDPEIAEAVSMPVNTVKTRLYRARQELKRRLAGALGKERS
jgi:RNA polymerase sigma-70 factor (ECF subfamily)